MHLLLCFHWHFLNCVCIIKNKPINIATFLLSNCSKNHVFKWQEYISHKHHDDPANLWSEANEKSYHKHVNSHFKGLFLWSQYSCIELHENKKYCVLMNQEYSHLSNLEKSSFHIQIGGLELALSTLSALPLTFHRNVRQLQHWRKDRPCRRNCKAN